MDEMYRRNDFRSWFDDVGFIYLIVIVLVALIFLLKDIGSVAVDNDSPVEQANILVY